MSLRPMPSTRVPLTKDANILLLSVGDYVKSSNTTESTLCHYEICNSSYYDSTGTVSFQTKENDTYQQSLDVNTTSRDLEITICNEEGYLYENVPDHYFILEIEYEF